MSMILGDLEITEENLGFLREVAIVESFETLKHFIKRTLRVDGWCAQNLAEYFANDPYVIGERCKTFTS